jgi:hypothetical protein
MVVAKPWPQEGKAPIIWKDSYPPPPRSGASSDSSMHSRLGVALALVLATLALIWQPQRSARGQATDGIAWLDPSPLEMSQGGTAATDLINPNNRVVEVRVEAVRADDMKLTVEPGQSVIPALGRLTITVMSSGKEGTGALVAWADGGVATKEIVVNATDPTPPVLLPSTLPLTGWSFPVANKDWVIVAYLPENPGRQEGSPCSERRGTLIGHVGGPDGQVADVCLTGRTLTIVGADSPGTWSGTIDVLPSEVGSIDLTISVRDFWFLPLVILVAGLLLALWIPLSGVRRSRLTLQYYLAAALERVEGAYESTKQAIRRLANDQGVGIDCLHDSGGSLHLDRQAASLIAGMETAIDAAARAEYVPPDGRQYTTFRDLVQAVLAHYALLLSLAERSARLSKEVRDQFPSLPVGRARILNAALKPVEQRLDDAQDWGEAQRQADGRRANLERFQSLWRRIQALGSDAEAEADELLKANDEASLTAVEGSIRKKETAQQVAPQADAVVPPKRRRRARRPGAATSPKRSPLKGAVAVAAFSLIVLVVAVFTMELYSASGRVNVIDGGRSRSWLWVIAIGILVAVLALVLGFGRRRRAHRAQDAARLKGKIKRLDRQIAWIGGAVVVTTGVVTLYLQKATFGGLADYLTVATWGFALGSGVNIAKRLIPLKSIEVV